MSRRIEIELTSQTASGSWTWRAAGARQPRGTLDTDMVPAGAGVGDVMRAEVESGIEGIEVVEVLPPKAPRGDEPQPDRIEVIGAPQRGPDVSVTLAPGSRRRRDDDDRPGRRDGPRRDGQRRDGPRRDGQRREGQRRPDGGREGARRAGPPREGAPAIGRDDADDATGARAGGDRRGGRSGTERRGSDDRGATPAPRRDRRPAVSTAHRNALLGSLRPEQLPVAEQLLRGGIPAVRQAIDEQNTLARAEGTPPASSDALLKMAEELLPGVKLAEWKDRATSARAAGRELRLRELRAVVAASRTVTLDEEGRTLSKALREALDQRVGALREDWVARLAAALDEGRVLDALRISAHTPEPGTRCPSELAVRLADAAGAAMSADLDPLQWQAMLDAVVDSPVRRTVKPAGIPETEELHAAARNAAGLVPELAKLLGLRIPPPPPRRTVVRRPLSPTGGARRASEP